MLQSVRLFILAALALGLAHGSAAAQSLKHDRYTLPNGMVVILHEDHTLPTVSVNLWYRVGARNEPPQRSGFAHLFEHLMFMGTSRVKDNQFDVLMEGGGGANNATTNLDRTNYFSYGPSELLPTLLWLDADRLERMGLDMTTQKLDKQRAVVRNERRQTVENAPYGKAYEATYQLLYPPEHPYHNGVIGTHRDLEAAQLQDVQDFFASFYVPANVSLVVAGDFDPAAVRPLIAKLYGSLPGGAAPEPAPPAAPRLTRVIRATSLDKVQQPQLALSYHSPGAYQDGDAESDLIAMILAQGKNSRLYRRLVLQDQTAVEVSAAQDSAMLGSVLRITVQAKPRADLGAIERAVDEEIARLQRTGPTADELAARKASCELDRTEPLQSVRERADRLNEYQFYLGQPDGLARDLARYRNASPESVRRWAQTLLTPRARLIQRVLPEQPELGPSARDARPPAGPTPAFQTPAPESFTLSNGIPVQLWSRTAARGGLPLSAARIVFARTGQAVDDRAHAGRGALLAGMLTEGTATLDGPAFAAALQALGAEFDASNDAESISTSVLGLTRNLPRALKLWADATRAPRMDGSDFARVQALHLSQLAQSNEEPPRVASRVALRLLLGDSNAYGLPGDGTPQGAEATTLAQVQALATSWMRPEHARVLIAGDLSLAQAKSLLEPLLGNWRVAAPAVASPGNFGAPQTSAQRLVIVDRPGAVQTAIVYAAPGVPLRDERRTPLELLGTVLGGSFTSRLNQNLREDHGYTYGASARFAMRPQGGWFVARSNVRTDATGAALTEFDREFKRLRAGDVSAAEALKAGRTERARTVQSMESLDGLLETAQTLQLAGLPWETLERDLTRAARTQAAELNRLAASALSLERGVVVLVGDKAKLLPQLKGLGLPAPIYTDAWGTALPGK